MEGGQRGSDVKLMRLLSRALQGTAQHLGRAAHLRSLVVSDAQLTGTLSSPQNCRVGDGAVRHLGRLPHLRSLNLAHCGVTDAGIQRLAANSVRFAALHADLTDDNYLAHCGVTDAGIQRLAANSVRLTAWQGL